MGYLNPEQGNDAEYTEGTEGESPVDPSLLDDQPLPAVGPYPSVVCTEASVQRSKKGNAMIVVTLSSADPEASAKYYIVNSKGSDRYAAGLAVFGVTKEQVKDAHVAGASDITALFAGRKISATGVHEVYLGSKGFKFDSLTAPPEGAGFREFGQDPESAKVA